MSHAARFRAFPARGIQYSRRWLASQSQMRNAPFCATLCAILPAAYRCAALRWAVLPAAFAGTVILDCRWLWIYRRRTSDRRLARAWHRMPFSAESPHEDEEHRSAASRWRRVAVWDFVLGRLAWPKRCPAWSERGTSTARQGWKHCSGKSRRRSLSGPPATTNSRGNDPALLAEGLRLDESGPSVDRAFGGRHKR